MNADKQYTNVNLLWQYTPIPVFKLYEQHQKSIKPVGNKQFYPTHTSKGGKLNIQQELQMSYELQA